MTLSDQVRLRLVYASMWSVARWTFLLSFVFAALQTLFVVVLWLWLRGSGTFASWDTVILQVTPNPKYDIEHVLTLGLTTAISVGFGVAEIVVATVGSIVAVALYRWSTRLTGGVNVGLQRP